MSMPQNFSTDFPGYLTEDQKVFQAFIHDPDSEAQFPSMMAYNAPPQFNPMALTTYGTAGNAHLPTEQELRLAEFQATQIYKQFHTENGIVTGDQKHFDAIQPIDLENLPKSVTLHGAPEKQTYFPDALTAEFYRAACRPNINTNSSDDTIPKTLAAQQSHVRVLVLAFNNAINCQDNDAMVKPFVERRHDQKLIECLAWEMLQSIIARAQSSDPLMTSWDVQKARDNVGLETFAARFDAVIEAMCVSKTICKHLNDAPYRMIFIDDPVKAKLRVESNRTLNKLKADQMFMGKKVQEEQAKKNGTALPNKRKRTAQTTAAPINPGANGSNSPHSPMQPPQQAPRTPQRQVVRQSARQAGKSPINYNQESAAEASSPYGSPGDEIVATPSNEHFAIMPSKQEVPRGIPPSPVALTQPFGVISQHNVSPTHPMYARSSYNPVALNRTVNGAMGPPPPGSPVPMQPEDMLRRGSPHGWAPQYAGFSAYGPTFSPQGARLSDTFEQDGNFFGTQRSSDYGQPDYTSQADHDNTSI